MHNRSLKSLMVIILFMSINQNSSVLAIFTFKGQRRSGFQISLDYSKLFGHMFLIGKKKKTRNGHFYSIKLMVNGLFNKACL